MTELSKNTESQQSCITAVSDSYVCDTCNSNKGTEFNHSCPYNSDINNDDSDDCCNCCDKCVNECCMDI